MPATTRVPSLRSLCLQTARLLQAQGLCLTTAESCTGGLIAAACTNLPGSSAWFERGFVTYSNAAKTELLGVDPRCINQHGAVSEPVARAMAQGAILHAHAQVAIAVTGIAGPTGGSPAKPVGTVWFAWATPEAMYAEVRHFTGNRTAVRAAAQHHALRALVAYLTPRNAG